MVNLQTVIGLFLKPISHNGRRVADSLTRRRMAPAVPEMNGQALMDVSVEPDSRRCIFTFDLGGVLETFPDDDDSEQWMLYEPLGMVVTYRADGMYQHQADNSKVDKVENWISIFDSSDKA